MDVSTLTQRPNDWIHRASLCANLPLFTHSKGSQTTFLSQKKCAKDSLRTNLAGPYPLMMRAGEIDKYIAYPEPSRWLSSSRWYAFCASIFASLSTPLLCPHSPLNWCFETKRYTLEKVVRTSVQPDCPAPSHASVITTLRSFDADQTTGPTVELGSNERMRGHWAAYAGRPAKRHTVPPAVALRTKMSSR